eukprot:jgi/Bigna1/87857/estExt_fgenesh1_pg.C_250036
MRKHPASPMERTENKDAAFRRLARNHKTAEINDEAVGPGGINARCPRGKTALLNAISFELYSDSVGSESHLVENGRRQEEEKRRLRDERELETVRTLIEMKADVNIADKNGFSPLHRAILSGNRQLVYFLINKGACKDATLGNFKLIEAEIKEREDKRRESDLRKNVDNIAEYERALPAKYDVDSLCSNDDLHELELKSWCKDVQQGIKGFIEAERKLWAEVSEAEGQISGEIDEEIEELSLDRDSLLHAALIAVIIENLERISNAVCIKCEIGDFASHEMLTVKGVIAHIPEIFTPTREFARLRRRTRRLIIPLKEAIEERFDICGHFSTAMEEVLRRLKAAKCLRNRIEREILVDIDVYKKHLLSLMKSRLSKNANPSAFQSAMELTTVSSSLHKLMPISTGSGEVQYLFEGLVLEMDWKSLCSSSSSHLIDALFSLASVLHSGANPFSNKEILATFRTIITNLHDTIKPSITSGANIVYSEAKRWFESKLFFCCLREEALPGMSDSILKLISSFAGNACSSGVTDPRQLEKAKALCNISRIGTSFGRRGNSPRRTAQLELRQSEQVANEYSSIFYDDEAPLIRDRRLEIARDRRRRLENAMLAAGRDEPDWIDAILFSDEENSDEENSDEEMTKVDGVPIS